MAKTSFEFPVAAITGKLSSKPTNGRITVHRQKCLGTDMQGNPVYGPQETYTYRLHRGKWSPAIAQHRTLFAQAQQQAKEALADPKQAARWQKKYDEYRLQAQPGDKQYCRLQYFVAAQMLQQLKNK